LKVRQVSAREPIPIRKFVGWTLVAGLLVAAVTASVALLSGEFDDTDWRVIGTSLGFSLCSALAASGGSLRLRAHGAKQTLGNLTIGLAAATFVLFVVLLWTDFGSDGLTRLWGCIALATLAASHASLMIGGRRRGDSEAVVLLTGVSIALGVLDAFVAGLPASGALDDVDEGLAEVFGVLVIALLLTTALVPIVRRLQGPATATDADPRSRAGSRRPGSAALAEEVVATADRIQELNADAAPRPAEIRRECERLRELARTHSA